MKQLWAPWRMEYIADNQTKGCIFCELPQSGEDEKNFILYRGDACFVIMNIFPYNSGHLMVSPYAHKNCVTLLTPAEKREIDYLVDKCVEISREINAPDGFNIGMNLGKAGGAGFEEHIHTHIVPRWIGDTNFMPVLSETKVHPEHLKATYAKLVPHFKKVAPFAS
ncbi:MAG: HIT domain-containing protein [Candidatus Nitrohelix vancouverensis]|uniref:HIT domain-containing protein n=1 Tax=Candidatus Nitrohelix vancouverensis TaxID=2705534 RepID=A0A7T0C2R4_9BACT|nr:MAG: HIT domain-containing protein [Candidatus Nitrohelix vancouverensis]